MFQEQISELTAQHLRTHINSYLSELQAETTGSSKLRLKVPEVISASLVGGMIQTEVSRLPLIGIDCLDKDLIPSNESLNLYQYSGAIVGMVTASDGDSADRLVKRYARVCEKFIKEHLNFHENFETNTKPFSFREFLFSSTRFSGSMEVGEEDERSWIAGFAIEVLWITSEDGEWQH